MDPERAKFNLDEVYPDDAQITDLYSDEELDIDKQITNLEQFIAQSDQRILIEKVGLGAILSGTISSLPVPDDGVGIPPRLAEYVLGKIVASKRYGSNVPQYYDIGKVAFSVHDAYCYSVLADVNQRRMSDKERIRNHTKYNLRLREVSAGRFMFWEQPVEVAKRAYSPHNGKLRDLLGFDIDQAISYTRYLENLFNKSFQGILEERGVEIDSIMSDKDSMESLFEQIQKEGKLFKSHERQNFKRDSKALEDAFQKISLPCDILWMPEKIILRHLPDGSDEKSFRAFLSRLSLDIDQFATNFRYVDEHNPLHEKPIIEKSGHYFIPHPRLLRQALMETFYYDLISSEYGESSGEHGGKFGEIWGRYIEEWTYDSLTNLFPSDQVLLNPVYAHSGKEAADVLVWTGKYLIVIQCKSKKLVLETRGGDFDATKKDLQKGIGEASEQADELIENIEKGGPISLKSGSSDIQISVDEIKQSFPIIVLGDQYDSIGLKLFDEILDLDRTPYVVSVIDLEVILEAMDDPITFISYISQRISLISNDLVWGQDEIDMLGFYLDEGREFPDLSDDQFLQLGDYSHMIGQKIDYKFGP